MRPGFGDRSERASSGGRQGSAQPAADASRKKPVPPEKTHAEEYYFIKQMNAKTPMIVVLNGDEIIRGWIEWYDQECIKVNRTDGPNLLVYKRFIKYLYKDPEAPGEA